MEKREQEQKKKAAEDAERKKKEQEEEDAKKKREEEERRKLKEQAEKRIEKTRSLPPNTDLSQQHVCLNIHLYNLLSFDFFKSLLRILIHHLVLMEIKYH